MDTLTLAQRYTALEDGGYACLRWFLSFMNMSKAFDIIPCGSGVDFCKLILPDSLLTAVSVLPKSVPHASMTFLVIQRGVFPQIQHSECSKLVLLFAVVLPFQPWISQQSVSNTQMPFCNASRNVRGKARSPFLF